MTAIRPCIISTAPSRPVRWSPSSARTAPASRRCSRASSAPSSRSPAASNAAALSAQDIAYLPQAAEIDRSFPINVYDMVSMGLWRRTGLFGGIGRKARDAVEHAIAAVGLTGFEDRAIGTLSGGQMQRMLFARLLLQDARVIVLDEPFNAVDAKTSADLFDLVRRWHGEKRTVLTAMHDIDFVKANFPETLLLAREPVAWGRTATVLTAENLLTARRMCEAFDERAGLCAEPGGAVSPTLSPCGRGWRGQAKRHPSRVRGSSPDPSPGPSRTLGTTLSHKGRGLHRASWTNVRLSHRPLRRVRIHAPCARRHVRAGARRRPDRRLPDAAPHEPRGRRDGARHSARRGGRISAVRAQSVRHDGRRIDRRLRGGAAHRARRAHDRAQGGCRARDLLPAVARARRHHRVAEGHQHRSSPRAVRQRARARRSDAAADRRQCDHHAASCWP